MNIDQYKVELEQEREKRLASEKMLDEKTREVQSSIAMMQHQFDNLIEKKQESDYLLAVARLAQGDESLSTLVKVFLKESMLYLGAKSSRYGFIQDKKLVTGGVQGEENKIPLFNLTLYKKMFSQRDSCTLTVKELQNDDVVVALQKSKIDKIAFIPIKRFSKVATICEFYFTADCELNKSKLDQCLLAGYQIGAILERIANKKKIEEGFKEIKQSHEKLKQAQSQLVQSEKMASLGQLAAGVAHEINNPIGFIMSNVNTLKDYSHSLHEYFSLCQQYMSQPQSITEEKILKLDEQQDFKFIIKDIHELIDESEGGLKRVKDIVANLKSFARSDDEEIDSFHINECIANVIKVVWNEIKYHVTLHKNLNSDLPQINGHEGQIGQVLMNIIVNAAQSIEGKGDIHIKTYLLNKQVMIDVKDNGKGMSESVKDKIFDPFFTTKGINEGTGLGLSISYGIIDQHGGNIEVESNVGQGTCFSITLPIPP